MIRVGTAARWRYFTALTRRVPLVLDTLLLSRNGHGNFTQFSAAGGGYGGLSDPVDGVPIAGSPSQAVGREASVSSVRAAAAAPLGHAWRPAAVDVHDVAVAQCHEVVDASVGARVVGCADDVHSGCPDTRPSGDGCAVIRWRRSPRTLYGPFCWGGNRALSPVTLLECVREV
ncbi:hypothetical protein [Streptomyces sp. NPDC101776]|uniref:hypothetical protein n=1 Tax=Streptomyces sp. NPDC101776 TaxID=3366146 RepID=UPI003811491F